MRNPDICTMRPGVLETKKFPDTQSLTDAIGLDSFMDFSGLVLQGSLVDFPYRQAVYVGK